MRGIVELILASTSKYRRQLLARLGVPFRSVAPLVDEETLKDETLPARELAEKLAAAKAISVSGVEPQATIIGSDQVAACDGRLLGKPGSFAAAVEQLVAMSGREHELITAVCIWHPARIVRFTDVTTLRMRRLSREEIERYVAADQPLDCAGSYKLEERGIALFDSIRSADHSAITGLPLIAVTSVLRELGFAIP